MPKKNTAPAPQEEEKEHFEEVDTLENDETGGTHLEEEEREEAAPLVEGTDASGSESAIEIPKEEPKPKTGRKKAAAKEDGPKEDGTAARSTAPTRQRETFRETRARLEAATANGKRIEIGLTTWSGLKSAMNRHAIQEGELIGLEMKISPEDNVPEEALKNAVFATVIMSSSAGPVKISIPFGQLYCEYAIKMESVDITTQEGRARFIRRQRAMAEKLYGLRVPFVITDMYTNTPKDPLHDDYSVMASRAEALRIIQQANFASGNYKEGDDIEAVIISVSNYSVQMNVGGIDNRTSLLNLTHRYINGMDTLQKYFPIGARIPVRIRKLGKNKDGEWEINVTAKVAELEAAAERQASGLITMGTQCLGIVTGVRPSKTIPGNIVVMLWLDGYDMPALSASIPPTRTGVVPQAGDKMRVSVVDFAENGMVHVHCRRTHSLSGLGVI